MSKRIIESCLTIGTPRGPLRNIHGRWDWQHLGWSVYYSIHAPSKTLGLVFNHGVPVAQEIKLDRTSPNYGGVRWWFICPRCGRRVTLLHRPSHTYYFFCRYCYDLTYSSVQSSHTRGYAIRKKAAGELDVTTRQASWWIILRYTDGHTIHEVKRPVIDAVRIRRTGLALRLTKQAREKGLSI
jgi:hypothetical protein